MPRTLRRPRASTRPCSPCSGSSPRARRRAGGTSRSRPPARGGRRPGELHIGFAAPSREHVDAFWRAGTHAGHPDDGAPGPRPDYRPDYYGSFLRDPDGNSAEAVHHSETAHGRRTVDHLWIRVADLSAARRFYRELAPRAGMAIGADEPHRLQLRDATGSFSLVTGTPTEHAALTLRAGDADGPAELADPDGNRIVLV